MAKKRANTRRPAAIAGVVCAVCTAGAMALDAAAFPWLAFALWLASVLCGLGAAVDLKARVKEAAEAVRGDHPARWAAVLVGVLALHLLWLSDYPFFVHHDHLRDGGLYARQFATGKRSDLFSWGYAGSYTNIVPVINSFFWRVFGNTSLTFKVPAMLVGTLDAMVLLAMMRAWFGWAPALLAVFLLVTHPFHLAHARSSVNAEFCFFWTLVLLAGAVHTAKRQAWLLWGVLVGLALCFHSSVRGVAVILTAALVVDWVRERPGGRELARRLGLFAAGAIVGFGPRLWHSDFATVFLGRGKLVTPDLGAPGHWLARVGVDYVRSLGLYFVTDTVPFNYPIARSLLSPVVAWLFIAGLSYAYSERRRWECRLTLILALVLPLTHSALTDVPLLDYRTLPACAVAALCAGLSTLALRRLFPRRPAWQLVALPALLGVFGGLQEAEAYFREEPASRLKLHQTIEAQGYFLLMHGLKLLQKYPEHEQWKTICFGSSRNVGEGLLTMHAQERVRYYLPGPRPQVQVVPGLDDRTLYLAPDCESARPVRWREVRVCEPWQRYVCPPDHAPLRYFVPAG